MNNNPLGNIGSLGLASNIGKDPSAAGHSVQGAGAIGNQSSTNLNSSVGSSISQTVVVSVVDPVSADGWMDWDNTHNYLTKDLAVPEADGRIRNLWKDTFGSENRLEYSKKYYFIASADVKVVAYVSDSPTGSPISESTIFMWGTVPGTDRLIVQQNTTSADNNSTASSSQNSGLLNNQLNNLPDDNNGNTQGENSTPTAPAQIPYRDDFAPIDPSTITVSAGASGAVFDGIVQSDNLRFDINSSNMFAGIIEDQVVEDSIISNSYSPIEKEGISANRLKTIIVSDYDLINLISRNVLRSSLEYSKLQHDNLYGFYNSVLFPDVELLTELEDVYSRKKFRLLKAIQFIKEIDEFKIQFINTITDYDSYGLQILGYLPGLNSTTAIRQAFYDLSSYVELGGYFLSNKLNGVYETTTGISTHQDFSPRILNNDYNAGYEFQTVTNWINASTEILDSSMSIYGGIGNSQSDLDSHGNYIMYKYKAGFEAQRQNSSATLRADKLYNGVMQNWEMFNDNIDDLFNDSLSAKAAHLAQGVYVNILKSYVVNSNGLSNAPDLGEEYFGTRNYLLGLAGDAIDDRQGGPIPLASLDNTKKLAQILRYNSAENSVYPFEKPNVNFSGDVTNSVSGIEKWFDSNIGNILEGRETDYRGLDNFAKLFQDLISETERKLNAFNLKGHGQIIFNEIIRAFQKIYDGTLDTETHPQPGVNSEASKGGFIFDDYSEPVVTYNVEDVLDGVTDVEDLVEVAGAEFAKEKQEAAARENAIVENTVREGMEDAAQEIAYMDSVQDDMNAMFNEAMNEGSINPDGQGEGDEFINSSDFSTEAMVGLGTEMTGEDLASTGEGYTAAAYGVSMSSANAVGEVDGFSNVGGANNVSLNNLSTSMNMVSQQQTQQYTAFDLSDSTVMQIGDVTNADPLAQEGIQNAEFRAGFSKGKEHLFRKLLFIIDMFSNIASASDNKFWNLSYNSVQGQLEVNPASPGFGTDHRRYAKYIHLLTKNSSLYRNFDTGASMYCHGLTIINSICAEIEKNLAYDIAVASNEYGITNRTPGEYSDANAVSILSTVFNNTDTELIYTSGVRSFEGDEKKVFLKGHNLFEGVDNKPESALSHIHLRALVLQIVSLTCKVFKSQNKLSSKQLTSVSAEPGTEGKISRGYVTVNSNLDRLKLEAAVTQMFLPVIDNVDPTKGPVRWQIGYGNWSESGLKLENQDYVDQFVIGKGVEKTLAGEFSLDVHFEGHVIPNGDLPSYIDSIKYTPAELGMNGSVSALENHVKNMEASIRANFSFLLRKEDIVPYNFIDNRELPIKSFAIVPPRGGIAPIIKSCIYHREDSRRLMEYLKSISRHYSLAQQNMEGLIKDPNGAELAEAAKLPGIEANEMIKYSSLRQTFLRSFLASEESGIERSGYSPSATYMDKEISAITIEDLLNDMLLKASLIVPFVNSNRETPFFLGKSEDAAYGEPEQIPNLGRIATENHLKFGRIMSIGIPAGYIDQNKRGRPLDVLNRLVFIEQEFEPLIGKDVNSLWRCFWPGLFINRAELIRSIKTLQNDGSAVNILSLLGELKYGTIDKDTGRYVLKDFNTIISYINENIISSPDMVIPTDAEGAPVVAKPTGFHIMVNHVIDAMLKLYMDLYAGLNLAESSFSVNLQSNILYVDQTGLDNIDSIIEHAGITAAENILDGNTIVPFKTFYKRQTLDSDSEIAYEKYAKFIATTQSRLFSADQMTTMALVPNIFDRTFSIWTHMGQVSFYTSDTNGESALSFYDISDDGTFDSEGNSNNMAFNDFNAQTYFRSYSS